MWTTDGVFAGIGRERLSSPTRARAVLFAIDPSPLDGARRLDSSILAGRTVAVLHENPGVGGQRFLPLNRPNQTSPPPLKTHATVQHPCLSAGVMLNSDAMAEALDFPEGAVPGSVLEVSYGGPEESIEPGVYDGKLLGVKGNRITVRFVYRGSDAPETVVINLETGEDETCHAVVSDVRLKPASKSGSS